MQISRDEFKRALVELGHNPEAYSNQRISLNGVHELYGISHSTLLEAIEKDIISAHYDYQKDTIWVDALDAAHFFYCLKSQTELFKHTF